MNWKKWKAGFVVAIVTGLLSGVVGLVVGITWEQFGILLAVNIAKDGLLYLKDHPVDSVNFDTTTITKDETK